MTREPDACAFCKQSVPSDKQVHVSWRKAERVAHASCCIDRLTGGQIAHLDAESQAAIMVAGLRAFIPRRTLGLTPRTFAKAGSR